MTLMEHLYELRHRLFLGVLAVFVGSVIGFVWFSVGIPVLGIRPLGDILIRPYCAVPTPTRMEFGDGCDLLATTAFSPLQLRLSAAIMAGLLLTCPVWLYQIWAFVGPALYSKEKKFALSFVSIATVLFVGGMLLAYAVIPEGLKVLLGFGGGYVKAALDPVGYYKFLTGMMLIFGVSLELPLLLVMLNFAGVIKGAKLAKVRRYAFFGLIVFAGIAVPGNDPISMGALAVTLCILYEAAVQVTKAHDRRTAKLAAQSHAELPDTMASPLDAAEPAEADAAILGAPSEIPSPEPITSRAPGGADRPAGAGREGDRGPDADRWTDAT